MSDDIDKLLNSDPRPTVNQIAWVFAHLSDALVEPGSFRHLIYSRMGLASDAYAPLYLAGGMNITNAFVDAEDFREHERRRRQSKEQQA